MSRFTDAEIDGLYKALAALDRDATPGHLSESRRELVRRIRDCEKERAAEMSAFFWNRNPLRPNELTELFEKLDDIFKDR